MNPLKLTFGTCFAGQGATVGTPSHPHSSVHVQDCTEPRDTKHHLRLKGQKFFFIIENLIMFLSI